MDVEAGVSSASGADRLSQTLYTFLPLFQGENSAKEISEEMAAGIALG